jgi:hypothetical protein
VTQLPPGNLNFFFVSALAMALGCSFPELASAVTTPFSCSASVTGMTPPVAVESWQSGWDLGQVVKWAVARNHLEYEYAARGKRLRRATAEEFDTAVKAGKMEDLPELRQNAFVVQSKLDFAVAGTPVVFYGTVTAVKWSERLPFEKMEHLLAQADDQIILKMSMKSYMSASGKIPRGNSNAAEIVEFADGTRAIWKPGPRADADADAYRLARWLGFKIVPPTIVRTIAGIRGSLQFFVESPYDFKKNKGSEAIAFATVSQEDKDAMEAFYFLASNWDRHSGNQLVDAAGGLALIDNTLILALQTVRFGESPWRSIQVAQGHATPDVLNIDFPFEEARFFSKPNIDAEHIKSVLSNDSHLFDLARLESKMKWHQQDGGSIGFIYWKSALWMSLTVPGFYKPSVPENASQALLAIVRKTGTHDLENIFKSQIYDRYFSARTYERFQMFLKAMGGSR